MSIKKKLIIFILFFSVFFFLFRATGIYQSEFLLQDQSTLPWLYSTIGIIFSMIAAFAIQKEWELWNALSDAVKSEVDALLELWLWSEHFPQRMRKKMHESIALYLDTVITVGWENGMRSAVGGSQEAALASLNDTIYEVFSEERELMPTTFAMFSDILKHRGNRIHFSERHMPKILFGTLLFADILLISFSLFVVVQNFFLDYLFTAGIATLCFSIYLVIDDLDNPLRPGAWHLTTDDYRSLLEKIKQRNSN